MLNKSNPLKNKIIGSKYSVKQFFLHLDLIASVWIISNRVEDATLQQFFLSTVVFLCFTPFFHGQFGLISCIIVKFVFLARGAYMSVCLSVCLSVCMYVCMYVSWGIQLPIQLTFSLGRVCQSILKQINYFACRHEVCPLKYFLYTKCNFYEYEIQHRC